MPTFSTCGPIILPIPGMPAMKASPGGDHRRAESVHGNVLHDLECRCVLLLTRTAKYYTNCVGEWNRRVLQDQLAEIPADYGTLLSGRLPRMEPFTIESP